MWLYRLERRFGWLKIPNLMLIVALGSLVVYLFDVAALIRGEGVKLSDLICFNRELIFKGQIWRIITFIFIIPRSGRFYLTLMILYFYYFAGKSLQATWGDFKFTIYYLLGTIGAVVGGFLVGTTTVYYLNLSLFFALAALYPNLEVLFMGLLPVKIKWLAYLDALMFIFLIFQSLVIFNLKDVVAGIMAIINFLLFFGPRFFLDMFKKFNFNRTRWEFSDDSKNNRRRIKTEG